MQPNTFEYFTCIQVVDRSKLLCSEWYLIALALSQFAYPSSANVYLNCFLFQVIMNRATRSVHTHFCWHVVFFFVYVCTLMCVCT